MNPFSLLRPSFCSLALVCSLLLLLRLLLPLQATGCASRISPVFQLVARCVADARDASSFLSSCERFSSLFAIYATLRRTAFRGTRFRGFFERSRDSFAFFDRARPVRSFASRSALTQMFTTRFLPLSIFLLFVRSLCLAG